jgi:hypothetical protein
LCAIDFNHQVGFIAVEIQDEAIELMLAPELGSLDLAIA